MADAARSPPEKVELCTVARVDRKFWVQLLVRTSCTSLHYFLQRCPLEYAHVKGDAPPRQFAPAERQVCAAQLQTLTLQVLLRHVLGTHDDQRRDRHTHRDLAIAAH